DLEGAVGVARVGERDALGVRGHQVGEREERLAVAPPFPGARGHAQVAAERVEAPGALLRVPLERLPDGGPAAGGRISGRRTACRPAPSVASSWLEIRRPAIENNSIRTGALLPSDNSTLRAPVATGFGNEACSSRSAFGELAIGA